MEPPPIRKEASNKDVFSPSECWTTASKIVFPCQCIVYGHLTGFEAARILIYLVLFAFLCQGESCRMSKLRAGNADHIRNRNVPFPRNGGGICQSARVTDAVGVQATFATISSAIALIEKLAPVLAAISLSQLSS